MRRLDTEPVFLEIVTSKQILVPSMIDLSLSGIMNLAKDSLWFNESGFSREQRLKELQSEFEKSKDAKTLPQMVSSIRSFGNLAMNAAPGCRTEIAQKIESIINKCKAMYTKRDASEQLRKAVRNEIEYRFALANKRDVQKYSDSISRSPYSNIYIKKIATRAIKLYDRKHNDLIAPLLAGITFKTTILPILGMAVKAGITAGIATGISGGVIMPIINRIKQYGLTLLIGKAKGAFQESIIEKIKKDVKILIDVFRTKDPSIANKLMGGLTKFNAMT